MHDLQDLINQFENAANELKVVVFGDANPYFYIAHVDILFVKPVLILDLPVLNFYQTLCKVRFIAPSGHQYCLHCNSVAQFFEKLFTFHQDQNVMFICPLSLIYCIDI